MTFLMKGPKEKQNLKRQIMLVGVFVCLWPFVPLMGLVHTL